jgi:hypothetical protein
MPANFEGGGGSGAPPPDPSAGTATGDTGSPPASTGTDPGPASQPSIGQQQSSSYPAGWDSVEAYNTEAESILNTFMASIGWDTSVDMTNLKYQVIQQGPSLLADPMKAYQFLFGQLPSSLQSSYAGAEFGMLPDDYAQRRMSYNGAFFDATGQQISSDILKQAMGGQWSAQALQRYLQFGDPNGIAGSPPKLMADTAPWLGEGQTYLNQSESYYQQQGQRPSDTQTLAAWYRFGRESKNVAGGQPARLGQAPPPAQAPRGEAEVR